LKGSLHSRNERHIGLWRRFLQVYPAFPGEPDFSHPARFCSSAAPEIFVISGFGTGWNFWFQAGLFWQPMRDKNCRADVETEE
jgi:hypothetical protein